mmetsp:Transcript_7837/g.11454  ORF Transcript_7837/g.11454 Transcript_7837/m.11454 type:complete len:214 (-) Transcript_7837:259-900(-)
MVLTQKPLDTSQTLMFVSREHDSKWSPDGVNVTQDMLWSWPVSVLAHWKVSTSHNLMLRSAEQLAKYLPCRSKATHCTVLVCPLSVCSNSPDSKSQTLTVESSLADAQRENLGCRATLVMASRWPVRLYFAGAFGNELFFELAFKSRAAPPKRSRSLCSLAQRASKSMVLRCNRTTLVHFFSSRVLYLVSGTASSAKPSEVRRAAATGAIASP